jgi:type 2 lantibiotic biosynthesis protein LanM
VPALAGPGQPSGARAARPAWAGIVEQAVAAAAAPPVAPSMDSWQETFAVPFGPFTDLARGWLTAAARRHLSPAQADPERVAGALTAGLGRRLARLAVRTLVHELSAARAEGRLAGADGRQRLADFVRQQSTPAGLAALFREYPVLARLAGTACLLAAEAGAELLARFAADRAALVETLLGGTDPGPAVAVEPELGDLHRRGRSVAAVTFADGRQVIYKPRGLAAHLLFSQVIDWLNERVTHGDLRTARALARPGYGWVEFIAHRPLTQAGQAETFYRRAGVLLAALYAVQAADIHCENLIACGDQPVLVDAETLFHPTLPARYAISVDPAAEALGASAYRVAFLPYPETGENGVFDRSGMGGDRGQISPGPVLDWDPPATDGTRLAWRAVTFAGAANRPVFGAAAIEPAQHEAAVLEGFRLGYDAIASDRPAFTRLIKSGGDAEIRIIVRPSRDYARMLEESTRPELLRDGRDRERALDLQPQAAQDYPLWGRLARHEVADLHEGDIPLLTARPGGRGVWTSGGQHLPDVLDRPPLSHVLDTLAAFGEVDRGDQEWIISASLATRHPAGDHHGAGPMAGPVTATAAGPTRLLAAACGLADQIVACGMTCRDGADQCRVNWLGLQFVDDIRWMLLPMGASLADGYLGVAVFLAQLADLAGIDRYATEARQAVRHLPRLCETLAGRPDLLAAVGCGGLRGLGGISYGLARMAVLLDDAELREWAQTAVRVTAMAAALPGPPGWAAGRAGCLAAMTAVQAELGSAEAGALAQRCAVQLAELAERTGGRCAPEDEPLPSGFAAGPAGVGRALTRFAVAGADLRYALAGQRALRSAAEPLAPGGEDQPHGWCRGTAGLLMAGAATPAAPADPARANATVRMLASRPVLRDLSLCHGELGMAEALTVLAACGHAEAEAGARHRAGLILDAIGQNSRCCGTPGGVSTPGLLNGLAGIGYGLLRLGFAEQVPSVLLLEPALPHVLPASPSDQLRGTQQSQRGGTDARRNCHP